MPENLKNRNNCKRLYFNGLYKFLSEAEYLLGCFFNTLNEKINSTQGTEIFMWLNWEEEEPENSGCLFGFFLSGKIFQFQRHSCQAGRHTGTVFGKI